MRPLRLQALLAVAETGSIAAAARREGTGRAVIRRRLEELGNAIGAPLTTRAGLRVELTPAGEAIVGPAQALIAQTEGLRRLFEQRDTPVGHYRVAGPLGLAPPVTTRVRRLARQVLPGATFELITDPDPISLLETDADFALAFGPILPPGPWKTTRLITMNERLVATPEYLAKHGTPRHLDDLDDHQLVVWRRPGHGARSLPLSDGGSHPVTPWLVSNDSWFVWNTALGHEAICLLPYGPLPDPASRAELVPVLDGVVHRRCTLQAVFPAGSMSLPRLRTVWRLVRAVVAEF